MSKTIKDAPSITDHIADYMIENCPALSIETVLTRPLDAMELGANVALAAQRLTTSKHARLRKLFTELEKEAESLDVINEICRAALNARKHGDLKRDRV